jgi:5-amino-6-(5-phosphoribosylamino)uracil reductase
MVSKPYVLMKCAMSLDGFIDDQSPQRLVLSGTEDLARVDALRAGCDAIMVGAGTVRKDRPRLLLKSAELRAERIRRGKPQDLTKVTVVASGDLDPANPFFATGEADKLVYSTEAVAPALRARLAEVADVVAFPGEKVDLGDVLVDLGGRGIERLLVEGGTMISTQLLAAGLVDELQIAIAPFLVGEDGGPSFVGRAAFPWSSTRRMTLSSVQQVGDMAVLRYLLRSG